MAKKTIAVGGVKIGPGESACVDLPVADLYTRTSLHMPVQIINGKKSGPTLFVCAAIHGDELNGVEIIRQLLALKSMKSLRGQLIAVPIVNIHGFLDRSRYLPDRRDLNRSFPGSARGSVAARLAHTFAKEIVERADFGIDLHTGAVHRSNLPQVRANLDDEQTLELAREFDVPVIINAQERDGSLRAHAAQNGIPTLLYEAGEALRFDEVAIRAGLRGVRNVMRKLGMLPSRAARPRRIKPIVARSTSWVRAPASGIMRAPAKLGARVESGQQLAVISNPFGDSEEVVKARSAGIVIGRSRLPLAHEGDALFHIAQFTSVERAEGRIEEFQSAHQDA